MLLWEGQSRKRVGVSGWPRAALGRGGCQEAGAETEPRVRESLGRAESVQWGPGEEKRKDLGERDGSGLGEGDKHKPGRGRGLGGREWSPGAGGKSLLMLTPGERRGWAQGGQCPSIRRAASSFLLRKQDGSHCVAVGALGTPTPTAIHMGSGGSLQWRTQTWKRRVSRRLSVEAGDMRRAGSPWPHSALIAAPLEAGASLGNVGVGAGKEGL